MRLRTVAAFLSLVAPVVVYFDDWVFHSSYYFPGRYEAAYSEMAIASACALVGLMYLLVVGARAANRRRASRSGIGVT